MCRGGWPPRRTHVEAAHVDVDPLLVLLLALGGDLVQEVEVRSGVLQEEDNSISTQTHSSLITYNRQGICTALNAEAKS